MGYGVLAFLRLQSPLIPYWRSPGDLFISKFGSPLGGVQIWNRVSPQWNLRIFADCTASVPNLYCAPKFGAGPTPATGCSRGVGGASDKKLFLETGLQRPKFVLNFDEILTSPGGRLTKP